MLSCAECPDGQLTPDETRADYAVCAACGELVEVVDCEMLSGGGYICNTCYDSVTETYADEQITAYRNENIADFRKWVMNQMEGEELEALFKGGYETVDEQGRKELEKCFFEDAPDKREFLLEAAVKC